MFRHHQIFTRSRIQKDFQKISKMIEKEPQALLITQKGRKSLVILPEEVFD
jgi:PHD/YefM family antitoxin component YafN of YafNO toxin-antitoxin module